ncbi:MAG: sigma-54-dependent Fis family transcriptional regulator [Pseudomonadales bacterium]|nr:sigma-54-dependent Fis family transcriptional regulator [Pseudomonadales bacterium]
MTASKNSQKDTSITFNTTILIVDDDEDILVAGKLLLKRHYTKIDTCNNPTDLPRLISLNNYTAIMLDMNFGPGKSSGAEGFYWLKKILEIDNDAVVVLITAHGDVELAVEAMKQGATDFISKPWQNEKLVATLSASVKLRQSRSETAKLKQTNIALVEATGESRQSMLGCSQKMNELKAMIAKTAPSDANVLILGENGTGKELVARLIHQQSSRHSEVFMSVDLGAISESLFESELFGHKKGAFTDANQDKVGRIQAADGGTLFLDEIGNLPLHLQAKLLSVLEQRQVIPVGSHSAVNFDVRIVAATNLKKETLQDENYFRQDLLFRLNTVELLLPSLRERSEDIPEIANYYLDYYCKKYAREAMTFSGQALANLTQYHWPGNVRALRHAIERAVILADKRMLDVSDFQTEAEPVEPTPRAESELNLQEIEKATIKQALLKRRYNISHTAKELGLTRAALYRRMEKYGF